MILEVIGNVYGVFCAVDDPNSVVMVMDTIYVGR